MGPRCCPVRLILPLLLASLPVLLKATVLDPPSLRCASVDGSGAVTLTWTVPPDPTAEFLQYEVWRATSAAGPFTMMAPVGTWAQTTWTDAAAGANTAPRFYYLTTVSTSAAPNTSVSSDTLATIFLQVSQSVPLGGAVLDWNLPHDPPLGSAGPSQAIDREHPIGTWSLVASVPNTAHHWSQVIDICEDSLNYRISQPDGSGCASQSNATGAMFQDVTPPSIPVVTTVTVDTATNQAVLTWGASPEPDTHGYIIVMATPGGNVILDTVYGRLDTTYVWPLSAAGQGPESYTVAAIDTCLKGSPPSPNTSATLEPHTTVFLSTTYDPCAGSIRIERTPYVGWPVDHYALYEAVDGGAPALLATLDAGTAFFDRPNTEPGHAYCYVVRAEGTGPGMSVLSNKACRTAAYPSVPQWNYLRTVTVNGPGQVTITDSVDLSAFTRRLVLERSYNGGPWEELASLTGGAIAPVVTFTDEDVETGERSYTYRVAVEDSCGVRVAVSNTGSTILLTADPGLDGFDHLRWNGYGQWAGTVAGYTVQRSVADGPFQPVGTTASGTWEYADDVQGLYATPGKFCYYVTADEAGNPAGINASSVSNIACAVQQEEVWVPNAFIASGHNSLFKPVLAYAAVDRYVFTIYNRWGQQIWSTADREQPWDGRVDGAFVPQGVYAWYCSFRNGSGRTIERSGTVTFLPGM